MTASRYGGPSPPDPNFSGLSGLKPILSDTPGGEMLLMARQGYKIWGFAGGSAFHHMRSDVPERITGPELLEPVARAVEATLSEILSIPA